MPCGCHTTHLTLTSLSCDELGLYVLDDSAGWQRSLTRPPAGGLSAVIPRDVNHRASCFWDNGNEGGGTGRTDDEFCEVGSAKKRAGAAPWELFVRQTPIITKNSKPHEALRRTATSTCRTEFMHGLYDGGAARPLDYWELIRKAKLGRRFHLGAAR